MPDNVPETSTTLLRDLASDSQHARWGEFVGRYRPMMESFMFKNFPSLDADDIIQETLISLIRVFPVYHYVPSEKGAFRSYLTGVLRHRALKAIARSAKRAELVAVYADDRRSQNASAEDEDRVWREAVFEIALQQYLADDAVNALTKRVFTQLAVNGEKPETVAQTFGIARNSVDQIKSRSMARLRELVKALEKVDHAGFDHGTV